MAENPLARNKPEMISDRPPKRLGGDPPKLSRRVSEKFEKTKAAASTGMKKVKEGAASGVGWIKLKYHNTKLGQKK